MEIYIIMKVLTKSAQTKSAPASVSFSAFLLHVPLVGSCKCSLNRLVGASLKARKDMLEPPPPRWAAVSVLMSIFELAGKPGVRAAKGLGLTGVFWGCTLAAVRVSFVCCLLQAGLTALPRRARQELSLWRFLSRQVSDWTLVCLPMGGSAVALKYEKESVCFPKNTPLSQKKSLATNLHACLQKKNLVLPVL